jgi:hypothetical protein
MATLKKKVSVKLVCGDMKKNVKEWGLKSGESKDVMQVLGTVNGLQTGTSDYGDWVAFKGSFKATNLATNEQFRSGKCLLPEVASDLVVAGFNVEGVDSLNMAFIVGVQADEESATGYTYYATPLLEEDASDPLAALEKQVVAGITHKAAE